MHKNLGKNVWNYRFIVLVHLPLHKFEYSVNCLGEAVLKSTYNLCFLSKNKKTNVYPCKPQFYYIKLGFKGVKIIYVHVCFRG